MVLSSWPEIRDSAKKRFATRSYELLDEDSRYGRENEMPGELLLKKGNSTFLVNIVYKFKEHAVEEVNVRTAFVTDKNSLKDISGEDKLPIVDKKTNATLEKDVSEVFGKMIAEEGIQF
ncbi:MAG: hypothetical protein GTN36_00295 [Candidatus Aenigmarchaeota archaeon]|nr:hypothetical protein [Candidatus Aenigmarchaeota archaeon]